MLTWPQTLYASGLTFSLWFVLFMPVVFGNTVAVDHGFCITNPKICSLTFAFVAFLPSVLAIIILCGPRFKWRALILFPLLIFASVGICCDIYIAAIGYKTGSPAFLLIPQSPGTPVNDLTVRLVASESNNIYCHGLRIERKTLIPWLREYKTLMIMEPSNTAKFKITDNGTKIKFTVDYEGGFVPRTRNFESDWYKNITRPCIYEERTY